jgi:iron-regulated transporter 1
MEARLDVTTSECTPLAPRVVETTTTGQLEKARRLLYLSHFFAQFSESAWQFSLILFLAAFLNYQSLILISTYGLASGMGICLFGASAGRFVDGANRLHVARYFIWTENSAVLIATVMCYLLLMTTTTTHEDVQGREEDTPSSWRARNFPGITFDRWTIFLLVGIHFFGSLASILDKGFLVAIERDWVVVMSQVADLAGSGTNQDEWLSETNVMMKQLDLSSKVLAPAVAGFVIGAFDKTEGSQHGSDLTGAAVLVGAVNVASLIVEYVCTARIYDLIPALAGQEFRHEQTGGCGVDPERRLDHIEVKTKETGCGIFRMPRGLETYLGQPVSMAGLGLAML